MDNPWATSDRSWNESWTTPASQGTIWLQGDASLDPSTDATPSPASEPSAAGASPSDHQSVSPSPPRDSSDSIPETTHGNVASISDGEGLQAVLNRPEEDWSTAWCSPNDTQPPDNWEAAHQEKGKLNRAVPPELLDSLLHHCQQISREIWPGSEIKDEGSWRSGFDDHANIAALLAQLLPVDSTLSTHVQFSVTATSKAMNEALKLTRHLPVSASSPLSRLLASKGSLEWEKSVKAKPDIVLDSAHVGWRVVEKEDRLNTLEESKPRRVTGGLLSFWNRRASAVQVAPVEVPNERTSSPTRSSHESVKSAHSRAASPSKALTTSALPPPIDSQSTVLPAAPAPSAVSRFLNRFSRTKGSQHSALALTSDDLEFLSDIIPSASDLPDEDVNDSSVDELAGAPLPPKLPPPIPPPPKQSIQSSRPASALALGTQDDANVKGTPFQTQAANCPVLTPPLSPQLTASFPPSQKKPSSLVASTVVSGQLSMQQTLQPGSQLNSWSQSSFTFLPPQKTPPLLSVPPLLPPPPVSPPQTPRPNTFPSRTQSTNTTSHDPYDSDDEFSAFASFPPPAPAPFPSSEPCTSHRPPSPPSPPPRRSYERTHYPSSSSASSILSPASQSSLDHLYSTKSSHSASDSFDDFVSPSVVVRGENRNRTPSPPPLPIKSQLQPQLPRLDTFASRVYHGHTPSQTHASPTVHTSLINGAFLSPSVSDAEHRRTQTLVNHAAARGGLLWPNSPKLDEPRARAIPPPPPASASPSKSLIEQDSFDLLGDGDVLGDVLGASPPLNAIGTRFRASASPPSTDAPRAPFGTTSGPNKGLGLRSQLQTSPPPLASTPTPILSFSSLSTPDPFLAMNPKSSQPTKPKQTGGLSAQDLSFFEGL